MAAFNLILGFVIFWTENEKPNSSYWLELNESMLLRNLCICPMALLLPEIYAKALNGLIERLLKEKFITAA